MTSEAELEEEDDEDDELLELELTELLCDADELVVPQAASNRAKLKPSNV
jgi:hypothetical protein